MEGFALAGALVLRRSGCAITVRDAWARLPDDVEVVVLTPAAATRSKTSSRQGRCAWCCRREPRQRARRADRRRTTPTPSCSSPQADRDAQDRLARADEEAAALVETARERRSTRGRRACALVSAPRPAVKLARSCSPRGVGRSTSCASAPAAAARELAHEDSYQDLLDRLRMLGRGATRARRRDQRRPGR